MHLPLYHRFIRTIFDIGLTRLQRRLRYELRKRLDLWLPLRLTTSLAGCNATNSHWLSILWDPVLLAPPPATQEPETVCFDFLQQKQELSWPIRWNDSNWPRLWQFHLHYFDWARDWLEIALIENQWPNQASLLEPLLDKWIEYNPPGYGDGWHSYTLSLRTRNWIWLFTYCPHLATPPRIDSLWQQLCWLQTHPEYCHGGNHWLENLTALALGGLHFGGSEAKAMHCRSMRLIQNELTSQVLPDGGHEERSGFTYSCWILVELACSCPQSRVNAPLGWFPLLRRWLLGQRAVRLEGGRSRVSRPLWLAPPLDLVIAFADGSQQCWHIRIAGRLRVAGNTTFAFAN